jgi:hypothetical protein
MIKRMGIIKRTEVLVTKSRQRIAVTAVPTVPGAKGEYPAGPSVARFFRI